MTFEPGIAVSVTPDATWRTLDALLQFARRASEADGYALYEIEDGRLNPVLREGETIARINPTDLPLTRGAVPFDDFIATSYPLREQEKICGLLTFAFRGEQVCVDSLATLDQLSRIIETVYRLPRLTAHLASRVSCLEVELASLKIGDRISGLLASDPLANKSVETVVRHVDSVLYKRPAISLLRQLLPDLEDRLAERKIVGKAKQLIQRHQAMSEEQAYLWLINRSRITRRRLRDIANEIIATADLDCIGSGD